MGETNFFMQPTTRKQFVSIQNFWDNNHILICQDIQSLELATINTKLELLIANMRQAERQKNHQVLLPIGIETVKNRI